MFSVETCHPKAAPKPDPQCRHSLRSGASRRRRRHQAAARPRIHESGLLSPAPFLIGCAVAVPELKRRSAGSRAASDVQALVERTECAVVAVPGPTLRGGVVAGESWIAAPLAVLAPAACQGCDRRRSTGRGAGIGPQSVERSRAAGRPANREASDVGTVPNLLGHKLAIIGRIGYRLQESAGRAVILKFVFPAFPRKNRPKPPVIIGSMNKPPSYAVAVALAVVIVIVAVEVDIAAGRRDLHRRVAVRCGNGRGKQVDTLGSFGATTPSRTRSRKP